MKTTIIELEGTDKVGKSTIHKYLGKLGHYKYLINDRGILTQLVYRDKFKRDYEYELTYKPLIVLLEVDDEDFEVRASMHNEPSINLKKDKEAFKEYAEYLEKEHGITVIRFNTSHKTPYEISKNIIDFIENNDFDLQEKPAKLKNLHLYTEQDLVGEDIFYK